MIQATFHQLRVFEATARNGSFTKAAEELMITQPTVSSQVKQLSKAIGLPLFEQVGKQLYLTDAGNQLLATCHDIFERLDYFEMQVADLKGMKQGQLRLGVVTTAKYFVPRILGAFCQEYPDIDISLQVTNHQKLTQRMLNNLDDLYILSQPPEELDLVTEPFLENPLVVVARQDHPWATRRKINIQELNNQSFIMRESGSGTRSAVQELFHKYKVDVKVKLELGSNEAIKQTVAGGLGISVLSKNCFSPDELNHEFTILKVQHFPINRQWYAVYLSGKQLSVISHSFLEYLLAANQAKTKTA